eukprot:3872388-Prymnesium_polylepis.1
MCLGHVNTSHTSHTNNTARRGPAPLRTCGGRSLLHLLRDPDLRLSGHVPHFPDRVRTFLSRLGVRIPNGAA